MVESENAVVELSQQNMDDHCSECVNSSDKRSKSIHHGLTEQHKAIIAGCGLDAPKAIAKFF